MTLSLPSWLQSLWPGRTSVNSTERWRACIGAPFGIALTGLCCAWVSGPGAAASWLIAPMGASAVLLFAVPSSPLAQPWAIVGGNVVSALIGVMCAKLIAPPVMAAALAIFLAIGAMFFLRCIHPPSGAVALTAVLGGPAIHEAGFGFVVAPVLSNSLLLLAVAIVYNNLTGRRYPHSQQLEAKHAHGTADVVPTARMGFTPEDLHTVMREYNQVLDVSADDLEQLLRQTEAQAFRRRFGDTRCRDIMSRDVITVDYATELAQAWALMQRHQLKALPVIDRSRRVVGIVTRADFLTHARIDDHATLAERWAAFLRRTPHTHTDKHEVVGQIMTASVRTAHDSTPIAELVALLSDLGLHHVPVVDAQRKLVGMVTQTDLIGALYESGVAQLQQVDTMPR